MKVCLIAAIFHPFTRGGAETVVKNAALSFAKGGKEVVVITAGPYQGWRSFWPSVELWQGIKIYRFYPLNIFSFLNIHRHGLAARLLWHVFDMFNAHTYFALRRILKKEKPDLIMTHNLKGLGYTVPLAIIDYQKLQVTSYKLQAKWFHTLHDMGAIHPTGLLVCGKENSFLQKFFLARLYTKINIWLFDSPDVVISPSQFLLDFYRKEGFFKKSKTCVIKNPILNQGLVGFNKVDQGLSRRIMFNRDKPCSTVINPFTLCFLYLGQLEPYKGVKLLLAAWQEFKKNHPGTRLHLAGGGSLLKEMRALKENNFFVHGPVPNEKINELIKEVDYTVVPSLVYENAPTIIAESFSFGVPVVAARIGGIPEFISDGENGFLFTPNSQQDLLAVLERAASADWPSLSEKAGLSAEKFQGEKYVGSVMSMFSL